MEHAAECSCVRVCVRAHLSGLQPPDGGVGAPLQRSQAALQLPALPLRDGGVIHSLSDTQQPVSSPSSAQTRHGESTYIRHNSCLLRQTLGGVEACGGGACESGRQSVHLLGQELTSLPGLEKQQQHQRRAVAPHQLVTGG